MRHYLSFDVNFVKRFGILSIAKSFSTTEKTGRRGLTCNAVNPCGKYQFNTVRIRFRPFG